MNGNYNTPEARLLLLATAAIESDCGYYIKQINGPALGIWQMEADTHDDTLTNCDAIRDSDFFNKIYDLIPILPIKTHPLIGSSMYACAIARLKYSMDSKPLPKITGNRIDDEISFYGYYKRIYNTKHGKSTFAKWQIACEKHNIFEVKL